MSRNQDENPLLTAIFNGDLSHWEILFSVFQQRLEDEENTEFATELSRVEAAAGIVSFNLTDQEERAKAFYQRGVCAYLRKNYDSAHSFFSKSITLNGYTPSLILCARMHLRREDSLSDYQTGVALYLRAIFSHSIDAMVSLAYQYANGDYRDPQNNRRLLPDYAQAIYFYESAYSLKHPTAETLCRRLYEDHPEIRNRDTVSELLLITGMWKLLLENARISDSTIELLATHMDLVVTRLKTANKDQLILVLENPQHILYRLLREQNRLEEIRTHAENLSITPEVRQLLDALERNKKEICEIQHRLRFWQEEPSSNAPDGETLKTKFNR